MAVPVFEEIDIPDLVIVEYAASDESYIVMVAVYDVAVILAYT
jgi:hypothetical protein